MSLIVVTGGAGFIGSNIVQALNQQGQSNIVVVDDLSDGTKFTNLADCHIADYLDKDQFLRELEQPGGISKQITAIIHQGACSTTTEWDGRYMMQTNYEYSKSLLHYCVDHTVPFIYASSAAVYGGSKIFQETPQYEAPLNVYGYSKFLFDRYVSTHFAGAHTQIVGLRYFNVYGPREQHKGNMASVAWHFRQQLLESGAMKLFAGSDGYADGEQRRDFIYIDDVVAVNLWFMQNPSISGIYNVGTGRAQTFNEVAEAVKNYYNRGDITYIPFPEQLAGRYQSFTEADISKLRLAGYDDGFKPVAEGVALYMAWLEQHRPEAGK